MHYVFRCNYKIWWINNLMYLHLSTVLVCKFMKNHSVAHLKCWKESINNHTGQSAFRNFSDTLNSLHPEVTKKRWGIHTSDGTRMHINFYNYTKIREGHIVSSVILFNWIPLINSQFLLINVEVGVRYERLNSFQEPSLVNKVTAPNFQAFIQCSIYLRTSV